jgi:hypothetical protein
VKRSGIPQSGKAEGKTETGGRKRERKQSGNGKFTSDIENVVLKK